MTCRGKDRGSQSGANFIFGERSLAVDYEVKLLEALARGVKAALYRLHYRQETTDSDNELLGYTLAIDEALEPWRECRRQRHATSDYKNRERRDTAAAEERV